MPHSFLYTLLLFSVSLLSHHAAPVVPGADLALGDELVYASGVSQQPAWRVDSLSLNATVEGRRGCSVVRFNGLDVRRLCVSGDTLYAWNATRSKWLPSRPVGPSMHLIVPGRDGAKLEYITRSALMDTVSGIPLRVIGTEVITRDATGRIVRRLREHFAVGITSAVHGTFEVPTDAKATAWRTEQEFRLVEFRRRR